MAEDKAADHGGAQSGGTSKIVLIASLVNMVATVGIVGVLAISYQKERSQPTMDDIVKGQAKGHGGGGGHGDAKAEAGGHGGGHGGGGEHGGGGAPEESVSDAGKIM